jgi:DNA repair exonuclease SbcCD nuclease subunit
MSKALIWSDLHIHDHKDRADRLQNCIDVLNWIFEKADENKCEYIFFLGDLFHERAKIDVKNYMKTFEVFMNHMIRDAADRDMYLLVGNHDMYHKERWDVNSIKPLTAIPRVHLIDSPQQIVLGNRKIDWMPHTENPIKELCELKEKNGGAGDVLLGHMSVNGAMLNTCYGTKADVVVEYDNDMLPVDASIFSDWEMTFLGHYHGAQNINNKVEYVGSPLQLTFGEAFQEKHIVVLDLDTLEKKYIKNDFSPKHYIVSVKDIVDENYDLNGNFIRVVVDQMSSRDLIDLKRDIVKNYKVLSLDTKQVEKKTDQDEAVMERAQEILLNIEDMLEKYIKERGVPDGLDVKKLIASGKSCLESRN